MSPFTMRNCSSIMFSMSAYIVIEIEAKDLSRLKRYQELALPTMQQHGIRLVGKAPDPAVLEGESGGNLVVLLEADSAESARAWYTSAEYAAAVEARRGVARFTTTLVPSV